MQQYEEGMTATGPNGERAVYKGGQWMSMDAPTTHTSPHVAPHTPAFHQIVAPHKPQYSQAEPGVQVTPEGERKPDQTRTLLTPQAKRFQGSAYAHTGIIPGMGMGGRADRIAIINEGVAQAEREGIDPAELGFRQVMAKGLQSRLMSTNRVLGVVDPAMRVAEFNRRNLLVMVTHAYGTGGSNIPVINALSQYAQLQGGSGKVAELKSALRTYVTEFARVMSQGGGTLSDAQRREIDELLQMKMSKDQFLKVLNRMRIEMQGRRAGFADSIEDAHKQFRALYDRPAAKKGSPAKAPAKDQMQIRVISRRKVG